MRDSVRGNRLPPPPMPQHQLTPLLLERCCRKGGSGGLKHSIVSTINNGIDWTVEEISNDESSVVSLYFELRPI